MKKFLFALILVMSLVVLSCTCGSVQTTQSDSINVDTTFIDSVQIDTTIY